ncbi:MAG: phosphate acyltransferase PlsX [Pseudomonadota bacterium]
MSDRVVIALDAMGGDNAPRSVVRGAAIARKRFPNVEFLIFGDEARVEPLLKRSLRLKKFAQVVHTPDVVADDAKAGVALRSGKNSSMRKAIDAVRDGEADGIVSAGNTGALMAMSKLVLRTLPGIDRPAMASFFPTARGESVMLDLGANIDCDSENLVQFAIMGELFSRTVMGSLEPTVGLLNVGSEEMKGNSTLRDANAVLRDGTHPMNYHGFIEGDDIAKGTVDVVVTDGFSGNIALKTAEGTAVLIGEFVRQMFKSSLLAGIGFLFARPALRKLRARVDPRRYNGAVFLGLNGIAVKSHGGSDALGFATAIGVAVDMAANGFRDKMVQEFQPPLIAAPAKAASA